MSFVLILLLVLLWLQSQSVRIGANRRPRLYQPNWNSLLQRCPKLLIPNIRIPPIRRLPIPSLFLQNISLLLPSWSNSDPNNFYSGCHIKWPCFWSQSLILCIFEFLYVDLLCGFAAEHRLGFAD